MAKKPSYEELEQRVKELEKAPDEKARLGDRLQLLSLAIGQSSEGIAVSDLDGNLEYLNDAFSMMHGYSPEELIGKNLSIFHSPEQLPSVDAANRQVKETGDFKGEVCHVRRDGTEFPTLMHSSLIRDDEGKPIGMVGTLRDISDIKQADEALRKREKQATAAIEAARGFTFSYDIATGKVEWGGAIEEITGYTPKEFANVHIDGWAERMHPDDKDRILSILQEAFYRDRATAEYRFRTKNGDYVTLSSISLTEKDEEGKAVRLVGILQDVSGRKQAEEALRESEELFRHAFESANTGVCLVSTDGHFIKVNDRLCEIYGHSKEKLEGMSVNDITHPEDLELSPDFFKRSISGEMDNIVYEKRYIHCKGHLVWGQISSSIVRDPEGEPLYFISHVQDITQQKLAEEALKKSEEKFSKLFQASPTYISLATLEEGRFVAVNDAFTTTTGYQPNEVIGRTFREIGLWPDPDDREEFIKQIEKYGSQHLQEVTLVRKDGSLIDGLWSVEKVELEGKAHLISMLIDITEKKRAEEALRESEEKFRLLTEQSLLGIVIIQDGLIKYVNEAACEMTEYSIEEALDWKPNEFGKLFHPDDLEFVMEQAQKKQEGAEDVVTHYSYRMLTKSGKVR